MLLFFATLFYIINGQQPIIIDTQLGRIQGTVHIEINKENVYAFKGIQYANAPINELRFRPAQLNNTKWNGIYDASNYSDVCLQKISPLFSSHSENCLYLNIWTTDPQKTALLPVMLFIHGGGFATGAGSELCYNGIHFVGKGKDMVYVSINYRLGPFGFLQSEQLYNEDPNWKSYGGMNGVHDQIIALEWVKQNIIDYGGDPNRVTIFGESAGGLSVCELIISPLAKGLFSRGIIESGACTSWWSPANTSYGLTTWDDMLTRAGYPTNNLTYLRSVSADELLAKIEYNELWQGSVDQLVLTDIPANIYNKITEKEFNVEKLIIGVNSMDGVIGFPWHLGPRPNTDDQYKEFIAKYIPNEKYQNEIYSTYYPPTDFAPYPPKHNEYDLAWFTITGDCCLACPSLWISNKIGEGINNDIVYFYQFGGPGKNGSYYAPHASELPFVFDIPEEDHAFDMPWNEKLSNEMVSAWTNFAKYSFPNITDFYDNVNFTWPLYGRKQQVIMFRDTLKIATDFATNYRRNACDFWYNEIGIDTMKAICFDGGRLPNNTASHS